MARLIRRGEIWTYDFRAPDKRRPVLIVTRNEAIEFLHSVMVAPITSTIRGLDSELLLGTAEGLKHESAANFDFLQTVEKARLTTYVGALTAAKQALICRALEFAAGCRD